MTTPSAVNLFSPSNVVSLRSSPRSLLPNARLYRPRPTRLPPHTRSLFSASETVSSAKPQSTTPVARAPAMDCTWRRAVQPTKLLRTLTSSSILQPNEALEALRVRGMAWETLLLLLQHVWTRGIKASFTARLPFFSLLAKQLEQYA